MDVSSNADGSLCGNRFDGISSSFNFRSAHLPKHQIGLAMASAAAAALATAPPPTCSATEPLCLRGGGTGTLRRYTTPRTRRRPPPPRAAPLYGGGQCAMSIVSIYHYYEALIHTSSKHCFVPYSHTKFSV